MSKSVDHDMPDRSYRQRDGKHVVVKGDKVERFLPSGDPDLEPLAGTEDLVQRISRCLWAEPDKPLAVADLGLAPSPLVSRMLVTINRARRDVMASASELIAVDPSRRDDVEYHALVGSCDPYKPDEDFPAEYGGLVGALNDANYRLDDAIEDLDNALGGKHW